MAVLGLVLLRMPLVAVSLSPGESVVTMLPTLLDRRIVPAVWGRLPLEPGEGAPLLSESTPPPPPPPPPLLRVGVADWPRCGRA